MPSPHPRAEGCDRRFIFKEHALVAITELVNTLQEIVIENYLFLTIKFIYLRRNYLAAGNPQSRMSLRYDPEWYTTAGPQLGAQGEVLPIGDVKTRRSRYESLFVSYKYDIPEHLILNIIKAPAPGGQNVELYHLAKKDEHKSTSANRKPSAAVLHIHGGGYTAVSARHVLPSLVTFVTESSVPMFSVEYRLAPECPYPGPLEDCWTALKYLYTNSSALHIDPARIAVMGESAGGGLAAGLTILARNRSLSPPLAKQILIYPMLDDRTTEDHTNGLAIFSTNDIVTGWSAYLGDSYLAPDTPITASPGRINDVTGMPRLYLDVGQLDVFLHEDIKYAQQHLHAGIETELHVYPGVIHAFQRWAPNSDIVKKALANRTRAIMTL
jgi:acetyl esterase/lipase